VIRHAGRGRSRGRSLVSSSPLRRADPRTKLALALCASLVVMLPLERLIVAMVLYALLLLWARLLPAAARQVWRLKWLLLMLFLIDWLVIDLELAVIITLRLVLLAGSFALFFATTAPVELCLALEWMRVPYRYAFSVSLAFQSLDLLEEEWQAIHEAQAVRGAWTADGRWQRLLMRVRNSVALAVPAIVLTTKRAWAITEAAHARGFDSPNRRPFRRLTMTRFDWGLLALATVACAGLLTWRLFL
jgi:biotin transport system permease protein